MHCLMLNTLRSCSPPKDGKGTITKPQEVGRIFLLLKNQFEMINHEIFSKKNAGSDFKRAQTSEHGSRVGTCGKRWNMGL